MIGIPSGSKRHILKAYAIPVLFIILAIAMLSCGEDPKIEVKNKDTSAPAVPAGLTAVAASSSSIGLNWNAAKDDVAVTGYSIFRDGTQVATSATNAYTDTGLSASTSYTYAVKAYDAAGNTSALSTSASATTLAAGVTDNNAPSVPANLTTTAVTATQINLYWTASTDNIGVAGYEIWRGTSKITTVTGTSFSDTGLTASTAYTYTVKAFDAAGNTSDPSTSAIATTLAAADTDTEAPTIPTNLTATAISATQIDLSWTASTDNIGVAGYEVWRGTTKIATVTGTSFSDTGLTASTTFSYTVKAFDSSGNKSQPSTTATATTLEAEPETPEAPTNLTATAHDGYVTLSWDPVEGATSYNLYSSTTSGVTKNNGTQISVSDISTPLNHSGLVNEKVFYYAVTAVNDAGESVESYEVSATPANGQGADDTFYNDQWHLKNIGQLGGTSGEDINIVPVWTFCGEGNTCRGEGVRIAVVDDGFEIAHEDLIANVATGLSYNYIDDSNDPTYGPEDPESSHGTAVAGIIAARDLNGLGVRGVAPRANIVGYNLIKSSKTSDEVDAMTRNASDISISNNSWAPVKSEGNLAASNTLWKTAINFGLTSGRSDRGVIYIFAAGNGGAGPSNGSCPACIDNSNYNGYANYRGVMAVGAVTDQGTKASYSDRGANLWVSAPGGEFCDTHTITTTDRTGSVGANTDSTAGVSDYQNKNYSRCMNGTSSATPVVAGVSALVIQANPNLGWRDVRVILAETARKNDPDDVEWQPNGGGYNINPNYGFGVVDADAAVSLAKTWTANLGPEKTYITPRSLPNLPIPDNNETGVNNTITVNGSGITRIEFVEIRFSAADHIYSGDLEITLTSPAGTTSLLAEKHECVADECLFYSGWVFGSANFLFEAADGTWTLTVKDRGATDTGTFQSWRLTFYGT